MSDAIRQQQFLNVIDRDEAERRFRAALDLSPLEPAMASSWSSATARATPPAKKSTSGCMMGEERFLYLARRLT